MTRLFDKKTWKEVNDCADPKSAKAKELFETNNEKVKYNLINYSPIVFINGYFYKGNYSNSNFLMEAFCNSFEVAPPLCNKLEAFAQYKDFSSVGLFKFVCYTILIGLLCIILTVIVFYIGYRQRMQSKFNVELNAKINEALAKYYGVQQTEYQGVKKEES